MSGFLLLFHLDRTPIAPGLGEQLLSTLAHRGPDGSVGYHFPDGFLGHQHCWITPEEVGEHQPLSDATGRFWLVFDGRLDNRSEVADALGLEDTHWQTLSDATLVLLAFARWGERSFARLLGPFAVVVVDTLHHRVVCARDPLGERTLFYHCTPRLLLVASEEQALLAHPVVTERLNEARLAAYFALHAVSDGSTFFVDVTELLPGHVMMVEEKVCQIRRYWHFATSPSLRYRREEEYAEHFRTLLSDSVARRLRTHTPPAVMMSGGLDSTAVAAVASRQLRTRGDATRVRTISYVFDELRSCDERWFIESMQEQYDLASTFIVGDDAWPLRDVDTWPLNPNTPESNLYRRLKDRVYHTAAAIGSRVLLTGIFGDELYSGESHWLGDMLREYRFRQAWETSVAQVRRHGLYNSIVDPALRRLPGVEGWRRLRRTQLPFWLTHSAKAQLTQTESWMTLLRKARRPEQYETLVGCYMAHDSSGEIFHASRFGIELWHPYRDRRLIEFMLAVPAHLLYRPGMNKHILREAMRGVLPERIRTRSGPTSLSPLFFRGIGEREKETAQNILRRPTRMWPEYVRQDWLDAALPERMSSEAEALVLWQCVCLELWLMHQTKGGEL